MVRCDDDDDEEEAVSDNNYANYGDYEPPTKEYTTDPKIVSRNVKCLGKIIQIIHTTKHCFFNILIECSVSSNNTGNGKCNQESRSTEEG